MALTPQDIARVANLARLELRPDETERVLGQLNGFFKLVEQMDAVNTAGIEPLAHPAAILGMWRCALGTMWPMSRTSATSASAARPR